MSHGEYVPHNWQHGLVRLRSTNQTISQGDHVMRANISGNYSNSERSKINHPFLKKASPRNKWHEHHSLKLHKNLSTLWLSNATDLGERILHEHIPKAGCKPGLDKLTP